MNPLRVATLCLATVLGCASPENAPSLDLAVSLVVAQPELERTDLGYAVSVTGTTLALRDLQFTAPETLAVDRQRTRPESLRNWGTWAWSRIVPSAHAHPGHGAGGAVAGELSGEFLASWTADAPAALGVGRFLLGQYGFGSFEYGSAPLIGAAADGLHAARLSGSASREGQEYPFEVILDAADGRTVEGIAFDALLAAGDREATVEVQLRIVAEQGTQTLFDGVDFAALANAEPAASLVLRDDESAGESSAEAHALVAARLTSHDYFSVRLVPPVAPATSP